MAAAALRLLATTALCACAASGRPGGGGGGGSGGAGLTIGIVGSGIGGASAAYFLRQELPNATLVVFEKDTVGGRVRSDDFEGSGVEVGAASWHASHRYMNTFAEVLGLELERPLAAAEKRGPFAVWDGRDTVFKQSPSNFWTVLQMFWRYGLSPLYSQRATSDVERRFSDVYGYLEDPETHPPWEKHETILRHLGLYGTAQKSLRAYLRDAGFTASFIEEVAEGIMRGNYGQRVSDVNALAGLLGMCGGQDQVVRVKKGNAELVKGLLKLSGVKMAEKSRVVAVKPNAGAAPPAKPLTVVYDRNYMEMTQGVDAVVLAAPVDLAEVALTTERGKRYRSDPPSHYALTHVAFVLASALSPHYFRLLSSESDPTLLLTMEEDLSVFLSLGVCSQPPANTAQRGYKVLSRESLSEQLLDSMFINRTGLLRHSWHAFPAMNPSHRYPAPVVAPRVYYPTSFETVVPLMEAAAISARNAVNLLMRDRAQWRRMPPRHASAAPPADEGGTDTGADADAAAAEEAAAAASDAGGAATEGEQASTAAATSDADAAAPSQDAAAAGETAAQEGDEAGEGVGGGGGDVGSDGGSDGLGGWAAWLGGGGGGDDAAAAAAAAAAAGKEEEGAEEAAPASATPEGASGGEAAEDAAAAAAAAAAEAQAAGEAAAEEEAADSGGSASWMQWLTGDGGEGAEGDAAAAEGEGEEGGAASAGAGAGAQGGEGGGGADGRGGVEDEEGGGGGGGGQGEGSAETSEGEEEEAGEGVFSWL